MSRKKLVMVLIAVVVITGALIGYSFWNKPFSDPMDGPALKVTATKLFADFNTNETVAREKYVSKTPGDKVIEITGEIKDSGKNTDGQTYYTLETGDEMFGVRCVMDKSTKDTNRTAGKTITLRGFCDGYNLDVIVSRCKIVS